MDIARSKLKDLQFRILMELEKDITEEKRKQLLEKLEYLEALGDKKKGLLQPDQRLLLFTPADYLRKKQKHTDKEIYQELQISKRTFYLWKKRVFSEKVAKASQNHLKKKTYKRGLTGEKLANIIVNELEREYQLFNEEEIS